MLKLQANTYNNYYNYNRSTQSKNRQTNVNFGMSPSRLYKQGGELVTDGLAHMFGKIGSLKPVQNALDFLKETNYQRHISAFVGVVLSSFYMIDTAKSKKIKKEDKMPLIVNQGTVCALSTAGAYTIDKYLDKRLANFTDTIGIANITDKKFQDAMISMHNNRGDYATYEAAAKVLKTPEQMINKQVLEVLDDAENLNKLKGKLGGNKYAAKLFAELEKHPEPKKLLQENYDKTEDFAKLIFDRFQFKKDKVVSLEKMVQDGNADDVVKKVLNNIKGISQEEKDKVGEATKFFKQEMKNSPILRKIFAKEAYKTSMDVISEFDSKLATRVKGFRFAKSMMVFATIYRFVAPVFATPLANSISAKIEARKEAKKQIA